MTFDLPKFTAFLHGGPRDGETIMLPWARYTIHLPRWAEGILDGGHDSYQIRAPYVGQLHVHYDHIEPAVEQEKAA